MSELSLVDLPTSFSLFPRRTLVPAFARLRISFFFSFFLFLYSWHEGSPKMDHCYEAFGYVIYPYISERSSRRTKLPH